MSVDASAAADRPSSDTVGGIDTVGGSIAMTSPTPPGGTGDSAERSVETLRADVADAVGALDELADRPVALHVPAYERLHVVLGEALSAGPDRV